MLPVRLSPGRGPSSSARLALRPASAADTDLLRTESERGLRDWIEHLAVYLRRDCQRRMIILTCSQASTSVTYSIRHVSRTPSGEPEVLISRGSRQLLVYAAGRDGSHAPDTVAPKHGELPPAEGCVPVAGAGFGRGWTATVRLRPPRAGAGPNRAAALTQVHGLVAWSGLAAMMRPQVRRARALRAVLTGPLGAEMLLAAAGSATAPRRLTFRCGRGRSIGRSGMND